MAAKANQIRIIGGQWRGRKLAVPEGRQLRPTTDRVRETLFNWLQIQIPGARCLDLFAGSGALGFEALSRGAVEVVMVEQDPRVVRHLRQQAGILACEGLQIVQADALSYLQQDPPQHFDVVFLDPPFAQGLLQPVCDTLEQGGWLNNPAYIYMEAEQELAQLTFPPGWQLYRDKRAGQVRYSLALRE